MACALTWNWPHRPPFFLTPLWSSFIVVSFEPNFSRDFLGRLCATTILKLWHKMAQKERVFLQMFRILVESVKLWQVMLATQYFHEAALIRHQFIKTNSFVLLLDDMKRSCSPLSVASIWLNERLNFMEICLPTFGHIFGLLPSERARASQMCIQFHRVKTMIFTKRIHPTCSNHRAQKLVLRHHVFFSLMVFLDHDEGCCQVWSAL
jgi:hypothetical protein